MGFSVHITTYDAGRKSTAVKLGFSNAKSFAGWIMYNLKSGIEVVACADRGFATFTKAGLAGAGEDAYRSEILSWVQAHA